MVHCPLCSALSLARWEALIQSLRTDADILMVRPTLFSSTPRLWNIFYSRYQEELSAEKKGKRQQLGDDREFTQEEVRAIEEPLLKKYEHSFGGTFPV